MMATSEELVRDLRKIDQLIVTLTVSDAIDETDVDDLCWLRNQRERMAALLAARRAQQGKKIVSLDLWRGADIFRPGA